VERGGGVWREGEENVKGGGGECGGRGKRTEGEGEGEEMGRGGGKGGYMGRGREEEA